jgi:hypothetical protein
MQVAQLQKPPVSSLTVQPSVTVPVGSGLPVGSPGLHVRVGSHTISQTKGRRVVMVVYVLHALSSPGRVGAAVASGCGEARTLFYVSIYINGTMLRKEISLAYACRRAAVAAAKKAALILKCVGRPLGEILGNMSF